MLADSPVIAMIPCVDLDGARAFYSQVLGLPEMELVSGEDAPAAAAFQCGQGTTLLVYQRSTPTKADHTAAGWMVPDVDAAVDRLIGKGVTFIVYDDMPEVEWDDRGVASMGPLKSAWFADPEGNILSVFQMP